MKKTIITVLSMFLVLSAFANKFNINKDISSSVEAAFFDNVPAGDNTNKKDNSIYYRYKERELSIKKNDIRQLKKSLSETPLTQLIKWRDKSGREKVFYNDTDIKTDDNKWYALKPYETLFLTAAITGNEKALNLLYKNIENDVVLTNQVFITMENLIKFYNEDDFFFFYKFIKGKNIFLSEPANNVNNKDDGKHLIELIALASSKNFYKGKVLDTLIEDYLTLSTPSLLVRNLIIYVNNLPREIYNVKGEATPFTFDFQVFYKHLDKNPIRQINLEDKCNFITDTVDLWRNTSQVLGDVYLDDLFVDTFSYLLDSLDLEVPEGSSDMYIRGKTFQWGEADFDGVIHDRVTQEPCTKFYYHLRESEKEPWAKKFAAKYGFEKTAMFVPLK